MRPFVYTRAATAQGAIETHALAGTSRQRPSVHARSQYLAGGTNLVDMMRLGVMDPELVTDINALDRTSLGRIEFTRRGLWLGALVHMADAADHRHVRHNFPVIAQSLELAASAQLRNMATLGGNVLQRTRCTYYRDPTYTACNKRNPGAGCAAYDGFNRSHAVLGTSEYCIATYPGDFAQALIALDAMIDITGPSGARAIPFAELHKLPGDTPEIETTLNEDDLIVGFVVPATPFARRSLYLKIRDRESFDFAIASAAVALDIADGVVAEARIALGGVATIPWRAREAEHILIEQPLTDEVLDLCADKAFERARGRQHNLFKIELGKRTLKRALLQAAAMEV
jgi:xanthine dehydrogenase YagS FAD-binding subunit